MLFIAALCACGSPDAGNGGVAEDGNSVASAGDTAAGAAGSTPTVVATSRPRSLQDTISVEGEPVVETWALVEPDEKLNFPFTTYSPPRVVTSFDSDAAGSSVRFTAAFGGTTNPDAYMEVRLLVSKSRPLRAENVLSRFPEMRTSGDHEFRVQPPPPFADTNYSFRYTNRSGVPIVGSVALGKHNGRYFYVLEHFPAEYGDGMGPRLARIIEHWRWEDTGRPLITAAATQPDRK